MHMTDTPPFRDFRNVLRLHAIYIRFGREMALRLRTCRRLYGPNITEKHPLIQDLDEVADGLMTLAQLPQRPWPGPAMKTLTDRLAAALTSLLPDDMLTDEHWYDNALVDLKRSAILAAELGVHYAKRSKKLDYHVRHSSTYLIELVQALHRFGVEETMTDDLYAQVRCRDASGDQCAGDLLLAFQAAWDGGLYEAAYRFMMEGA